MSDLDITDYWENVNLASNNGNSTKRYYFDDVTIRMTYYTRSGSSIIRQYMIPSEMLTELYCDMYTSEEYAKQVSEGIFRRSLRKSNNDYDYYNTDIEDAKYCAFRLRDKLGVSTPCYCSVEEGKELTEALRKDMASMSIEELKNSEFYCELEEQTINSACVNTIKFLEDHNVKCKKTSEELVNEIDTYSNYFTITRNVEYVFPIALIKDFNYENYYNIVDADDYSNYERNHMGKYFKLDSILSLNTRRRSSRMDYNNKHIEIEDKKAMEKLLDIAVPVITGEKVLATIGYDDVALYIKDEPGNSKIIENAINAMKIYTNSGEYSSDYVEFS